MVQCQALSVEQARLGFKLSRYWVHVHPKPAEDHPHTHATLLIKAGVPVKVVSERLGHANPAFTIETHQSVLPGMQADAAQLLEDLVVGRSQSRR